MVKGKRKTKSKAKASQKKPKWIQEKAKQELTIYVSRKNNLALPDDILSKMSQKEKSFWNERIFTKDNLNQYIQLEKKEKSTFIHELVATRIGNEVTVNKINEETLEAYSMSIEDVVDYVKGKFSYKQNTSKQKQKKTPEKNEELHITKKLKCIPVPEDFEPNLKVAPTVLDDAWFEYSMLHSMFQDFSFVLYNGSHKIDDNDDTHWKSRVVLKFPQDKNFFILFHGNLVHNGAAGKLENVTGTMNYSADLRAFAYIHRYEADRSVKRGDGLQPRGTHSNNPSIGSSYRGCPSMGVDKASCQVCNQYMSLGKSKFISSNGFEIDVGEVYEEYIKTAKKRGDHIMPIIGDLKNYGWAVYEGINAHDTTVVRNLLGDSRDLINTSITGITWNNLQQVRPAKTGRYQLKLSKAVAESALLKKSVLKTSVDFYNLILNNCIRKIHRFEESIIDEMHILRNQGPISEQPPHRDYEKIHRDSKA